MFTRLITLLCLLPLGLTSCTAEVSTTPVVTQTLTAGCGACTYHLEGAENCPLAVEVAGKPMLVVGTDFDAMGAGFCLEKGQVAIVGEVHGDHFEATSVQLVE